MRPTFTAPDFFTFLSFTLTVDDGLLSSTSNVEVIVENQAPVADAGPDQDNVAMGSLVVLNGSASPVSRASGGFHWWRPPRWDLVRARVGRLVRTALRHVVFLIPISDVKVIMAGLLFVFLCTACVHVPLLPPGVQPVLGQFVERPPIEIVSSWRGHIFNTEELNEVYLVKLKGQIPENIEGVEIFRVFSTSEPSEWGIIVVREQKTHLLVNLPWRAQGVVSPYSFCREDGIHGIFLRSGGRSFDGLCWNHEKNRYDFVTQREPRPH